jgi:hypothetical protein
MQIEDVRPTASVMEFGDFKRGPARQVMAGLGREWLDLLLQAEDYHDFPETVCRNNISTSNVMRFSEAVRRYAVACSADEWTLLLAIAALCDFAELADELAGNRAWSNLTTCSDKNFRRAIAACIVNC